MSLKWEIRSNSARVLPDIEKFRKSLSGVRFDDYSLKIKSKTRSPKKSAPRHVSFRPSNQTRSREGRVVDKRDVVSPAAPTLTRDREQFLKSSLPKTTQSLSHTHEKASPTSNISYSELSLGATNKRIARLSLVSPTGSEASEIGTCVRNELRESYHASFRAYSRNELEKMAEQRPVLPKQLLQQRSVKEMQFMNAFSEADAPKWRRILTSRPGSRTPDEVVYLAQEINKLQSSFFEKFNPECMTSFAQSVRYLVLSTGEHVFMEGDTGSDFYLVISGGCSVWKNEQSIHEDHVRRKSLEDRLQKNRVSSIYQKFTRLNDLFKGDGFGELAVFAGAGCVRSASVKSEDKTELLVVSRKSYNGVKFLQKERELGSRVAFCMEMYFFTDWTRKKLMSL
eukprot:258087_1